MHSRIIQIQSNFRLFLEYPLLSNSIIISGKDGDAADGYQERDVRDALRELDQIKGQGND